MAGAGGQPHRRQPMARGALFQQALQSGVTVRGPRPRQEVERGASDAQCVGRVRDKRLNAARPTFCPAAMVRLCSSRSARNSCKSPSSSARISKTMRDRPGTTLAAFGSCSRIPVVATKCPRPRAANSRALAATSKLRWAAASHRASPSLQRSARKPAERSEAAPSPSCPEVLNCDWHSLEESASDNHVHHGFRQPEPAPIGYIFGAYLVDRERNQ
jgi:hypothetical protein